MACLTAGMLGCGGGPPILFTDECGRTPYLLDRKAIRLAISMKLIMREFFMNKIGEISSPTTRAPFLRQPVGNPPITASEFKN